MFKVKKSQAISNYRYKLYKYKTGIYRLVEYCFFLRNSLAALKIKNKRIVS